MVGWGGVGGGNEGLALGAGGGALAVVVAVVVLPLVEGATPGVHEEVGDGGDLKAQLLGDGHLHLFGGALRLLEDGV